MKNVLERLQEIIDSLESDPDLMKAARAKKAELLLEEGLAPAIETDRQEAAALAAQERDTEIRRRNAEAPKPRIVEGVKDSQVA